MCTCARACACVCGWGSTLSADNIPFSNLHIPELVSDANDSSVFSPLFPACFTFTCQNVSGDLFWDVNIHDSVTPGHVVQGAARCRDCAASAGVGVRLPVESALEKCLKRVIIGSAAESCTLDCACACASWRMLSREEAVGGWGADTITDLFNYCS